MKPISRVVVFLVFSTFAASASGQFVYSDFCDVSDFTLNGVTGSLTPNGECVLRLTNDLGQSGSAFLTNPISLAVDASFSTAFSFRFTQQQGGGADGIVFVVQTVANNVGGSGGGIGYQGIEDSVGVEFDNWFNAGSDPDNSHIGIDIDGSVASVVTESISPDLDDGNIWYAWVDYNGVTDLLEVRISQSPARPAAADLSHTVDLVTVLGQTDAFIGFTSGTGAAAAFHDVLTWEFNPFFDPIGGGPEDARATFAVNKDFTDGNPAGVEVTISCNTGLPLEQSKVITEGEGVEFVVVDFDNGELDCEVTEDVPAGYEVEYFNGAVTNDISCAYEDVTFESEVACRITNTPGPVDVVIHKDWVIEGGIGEDAGIDQEFRVTLTCESEIAGGYQLNGDWRAHADREGEATITFEVIPEFPSTTCEVEETVFDSAVEVDSGCGEFEVSAADGHECTITNTVFFEGIPTLNQYGLALLALLMLGVGFVGFRRFA